MGWRPVSLPSTGGERNWVMVGTGGHVMLGRVDKLGGTMKLRMEMIDFNSVEGRLNFRA